MPYNDIEQSTDLGSPITLFEFICGDADDMIYRYATTIEDVVAAGRVWKPYNIQHGEIVNAGSLDRAELTVTAPSDIELTKIFLAAPPSRQVLLNIWRGHALPTGLDTFVRIWTGRVLTPNWTESELELSCEAVATSLKRIGLRRYYQYGCPHVLYGTACKVPPLANIGIGHLVTILSSQVVDIEIDQYPAVGYAADRLVGGTYNHNYLSGHRALRTITSAVAIPGGVRLSLMSGINDMVTGVPVTVSYGCKHNWEACQRFSNTANYGGCPNIPTKDPYRTNTF